MPSEKKKKLDQNELFAQFMKQKGRKKSKQLHLSYLIEESNGDTLLIRVERRDAKANLSFLSNYFFCEASPNKEYVEKFINPAFGRYKWKVESYGRSYRKNEIVAGCSIIILENYFDLPMLHEIMEYVLTYLSDTSEVYLHTYLHVNENKVNKSDEEKFISPRGYYKTVKGISIFLN